MHTVVHNSVFLIVEVAKEVLTMSISLIEYSTCNSGYSQLVNTIVYNYEFIEDNYDESDQDVDDDNYAEPNTPYSSSNSFPMTILSGYAQIPEWLIDSKDEESFCTSTEQGTNKQKWNPKTFSSSCHPLTLMVCLEHGLIAVQHMTMIICSYGQSASVLNLFNDLYARQLESSYRHHQRVWKYDLNMC